ncbi:YjaG family protein [Aidingimonas lacisalsi]|uniref:YjaG family protein n=1 Tax=Aidingimonas lacisalsi TaxID=2604086 RepID=UPI0011D1B4F9|nr:YjaG family protein [Aidingimonas lacisalsi]
MSLNHDDFQHRLRRLTKRQRTAFMAALCERLLPNYGLYADTSGEGDVVALRNILDLVWESLLVVDARIDFGRQAEKLSELQPPADDDSFGARRALETTMAIAATLDVLQGDAEEAVFEVSRVSQAGVIAFIELTESIDDEGSLADALRNHPLMDDEDRFQSAVLDAVEASSERNAIKALRRLGRNNGVSNLGLTLD